MKFHYAHALLSIAICSTLLAGCDSSSSKSGSPPSGGDNGSTQPNPETPTTPETPQKIEKEMLSVLSTRPDLVSDSDVLVALELPAGTQANHLKITLNGTDIRSKFNDASGRALLSGLYLGENIIKVEIDDYYQDLKLINHSSTGPIFSGPQLKPWTCSNESTDAYCRKLVSYNYYYKNLVGTFQSYDPAKPPASNLIATTTTDQGVTLPFIVREEVGYQNRDEYRFAVLFDPTKPWTALAPQEQFNHKLVVTHGQSCGNDYQSATAPTVIATSASIMPDITVTALGRGFGIMSTALSNSGHNCNLAVQAESLVMAKERFIEQYGTLRYTIGQGCSGGSLAAQWVANAYPGIYQGILPTCSFPDAWSTASQFADYHLMINYFQTAEGRFRFLPNQVASVQGHISEINGYVSELAQFDVARPNTSCNGISDSQLYNASTNPTGIRCSIQDAAINMLAPRPSSIWSDTEKKLGRGFAGLPIDNVGVQYGLDSLTRKIITAEQFVLLNEKLGGVDIDINPVSQRLEANPEALRNAYRTGLINVANNLNKVAIIDCRGPDPAIFHDAYRAYAIRARLDQAHGHHNNHLIYGGDLILFGDTQCLATSFDDMDRWLAAVEKDTSSRPIDQKLTTNKPADLNDSCFNLGVIDRTDMCSQLRVPVYRTPRMVAGDSITTYANKCQLKPLRESEYGNTVRFTTKQWQRLQAVFPNGVCDYTKPPVGFSPTIPWLTYQDSQGIVQYGGLQMPTVSHKSARGWASPAFDLF